MELRHFLYIHLLPSFAPVPTSFCLSIYLAMHHCQVPEIIYSGYLDFKLANIL